MITFTTTKLLSLSPQIRVVDAKKERCAPCPECDPCADPLAVPHPILHTPRPDPCPLLFHHQPKTLRTDKHDKDSKGKRSEAQSACDKRRLVYVGLLMQIIGFANYS